MIRDHVWRPAPHASQPCAYMNCRRPRAEHEFSVSCVGGTKVVERRIPVRS